MIDRYKNHDMPLGWLLPNDGYGAGYGQTETLDGNIQNLKELGDYARKNGVEIGLWTQSDLHPKEGISALLQRDIVKEVRDAGVRVLKTDVAWVGAGYSFGLNGVADVGKSCLIMATTHVRLSSHWTDGQELNAMQVYGRVTRPAANGNTSASISRLISVRAFRDNLISLPIWMVSLAERTRP